MVAEVPANTSLPTVGAFPIKVTFVKLVQSSNAQLRMELTLLGMVRLFNPVQP